MVYMYEERYGESVGRCRIHHCQVIDNHCDLCFSEIEWLSECCDSSPSEEIDMSTLTGFCSNCRDQVVFRARTYDE